MDLADAVTEWLKHWEAGDEAALDRVMPVLYQDLKRLAAAYLNQERPDHTLQPTALVHEAYLQVRKLDRMNWNSRAHFIAVAAGLMRRILVDHARQRLAAKRGGSHSRVVSDMSALPEEFDPKLVQLEEALGELAKVYPRKAQVVELKFFGGLTAEEIADVMGGAVTSRTVERDWRFARAWLQGHMAG